MNNILERVSPEQVGLPSKAISNFIDSIYEKQINMHSFMILRHGKIAAEAYFKPFHNKLLHSAFSVSKSVTSAAIGIAIGEGLISLEDKVVDFFPDKIQGQVHRYTGMMKIKDLLSMATVHPHSTSTKEDDWINSFLNTHPSHIPGTTFAYDTTGTHTLCGIIQKVTGMTVLEYLRTRLFNPIGIGEIQWESCPMGINKGGSGIKCTTEDLARFGQLYLRKGNWNGMQILPEGWVDLSTSKHIDNSSAKMLLDVQLGYGYLFWITRNNSYCAFGMGGQLVVVLPEKDTVFVCTANTLLYRDGQQMILESFWEKIYPEILDYSLEQDTKASNALKEKIENLHLVLPKGNDNTYIFPKITKKKYKLEDNNLKYDSCEFEFNEGKSTFRLWQGNKNTIVHFGMNKWIKGIDPFLGLRCTSAATWVDNKTCVMHIEIFEIVQRFILTCHFENENIVIQIQSAGVENSGKFETYLNSI